MLSPCRRPTHSPAPQTDTSIYNNLNDLGLDWARAGFDRTHRFTANFEYQIPSPRRTNGFGASALSGWSLTGIVIVQSGLPMTLTDPNAGGVYDHAATSTITLCPGATYASLVAAGEHRRAAE